MFEPADNPEINSLHAPSDQGFYALIIGDILTESREYSFLPKNLIEFSSKNVVEFLISDVNSLLMTEKHHTEF